VDFKNAGTLGDAMINRRDFLAGITAGAAALRAISPALSPISYRLSAFSCEP
jgi:hypothetical protein